MKPPKIEPYTPPKLAHALDRLELGALAVINSRKTKLAGKADARPASDKSNPLPKWNG